MNIDLRGLLRRLQERGSGNVVISYEGGKPVRRTHQCIHSDVVDAVTRLRRWGIRQGMRVGILGKNCYQWVVYDLALLELQVFSIAFTESFASEGAESLISRYGLSLLLVDGVLTDTSWLENPSVVLMSSSPDDVKLSSLEALEESTDFTRVGLAFSSGSSGRLKGLILNRLGIEASVDAFAGRVNPKSDDCLLLFLPISNFQQRLMYYAAFWYGFDLIVTDPTRLFPAMRDLNPSILIAPPLLYEGVASRFYNLPAAKQWMAICMGKLIRIFPGQASRHMLAERCFKHVHAVFGKRMRFMVTGMAPIKRSTLDLFALMQLPLFETYGLTEFGSITLNVPGANKIGSVGRPLPGVGVEFLPDGEVVAVREQTIASSYAEGVEDGGSSTFLGSGRIATGDVGYLDPDGYLFLIGRKKEMILTPGGEKVHPEMLEAQLDACTLVERSVVFAYPDTSSLTAIILPRDPTNTNQKKAIEEFVSLISVDRGQLGIEKIIFIDTAFSIENGMLRPNLKLDRTKIVARFGTLNTANNPAAEDLARSVSC